MIWEFGEILGFFELTLIRRREVSILPFSQPYFACHAFYEWIHVRLLFASALMSTYISYIWDFLKYLHQKAALCNNRRHLIFLNIKCEILILKSNLKDEGILYFFLF